jgi:hypothetical protein
VYGLVWLIGKAAAGAYRAGGHGLPLNLTLGAPPIGRSDSGNRTHSKPLKIGPVNRKRDKAVFG